MYEVHYFSRGEENTSSVAELLAPLLHIGHVVLLNGGLAAGKTYFVKALVNALGSDDLVTSPTFALAQFYETSAGSFLHVDAYRLSGLAEYRDLGIDEYVDVSITAIEWGDKVAEYFPDALHVSISFAEADDGARDIKIYSSNEQWRAPLQELEEKLRGLKKS